jgi:hypothetical protein
MCPPTSLRWFAWLCCCYGVFFVAGCSSQKGATIQGKVVLPTGVQLKDNDAMSIILAPVEATVAAGGTGTVKIPDLTFTIAGNDGKGVPPGKYKVGATCVPYDRGAEGAQRKKQLEAAFAPFSLEKTTLTVDLTGAEQQQITVDLQSKTVSK